MDSRKSKLALVICLSLFSFSPALSQNNNSGGMPGNARPGQDMKDNVEARLKRQHMRIRKCIEAGTITQNKATELKQQLDALSARINTQRQQNGGELKPEQLKQAENSLNQSNLLIKSFEAAGTHSVDNGKVLGPDWTQGKDGAQNPTSLLKQEKREEKRELRQEKQANEQTLEQQQLDYEKQMTTKLGNQRKKILQQKQDLKQIRKDSGAD